MLYIANAISGNMFGWRNVHDSEHDGATYKLLVKPLSKEQVLKMIKEYKLFPGNTKCVIGHQDLLNIVNKDLETNFEYNRETIYLGDTDDLIVAQYVGARLPEGCTELPKGAELHYVLYCWEES